MSDVDEKRATEVILDRCYQGNALIDLSRSICVFGKLL
jgi:hypothetical protein